MKQVNLNVCSFNVQGGLSTKCSDNDFINLVKSSDIFCIQESWLTENKSISIKGYDYFRSDRYKGKKCKRGHGGIVNFFKTEFKKGIVKLKSQSPDIIWIKLCKKFFGLQKDLYISSVYISPQDSFVHKETDMFQI